MRRVRILLAAGLIVSVALARADDPKSAKATAEPVSLNVSRKVDEKNFPFQTSALYLTFKLAVPDRQLLGVDPSGELTELKDDKDNSLLPKTGFFKPNFNTYAQIATDRRSMLVSVNAPNAPTKGATKIHVKGKVVALCGSDEKTTDEKEVAFKAKTEEKVGDFTFKVNQEKGFGGQGATFTITGPRPVIKTVTVKDADGKTAELSLTGSYGFGKNWTSTYVLKKVTEKGKLSVTYFAKEEKVTVPVDFAAGVGL